MGEYSVYELIGHALVALGEAQDHPLDSRAAHQSMLTAAMHLLEAVTVCEERAKEYEEDNREADDKGGA